MQKSVETGVAAIEKINGILSGALLPAVLTALSVFLFIYLRGRPFRRESGLPEGGAPSKKATLMALAGTLGVGNITGVADAVRRGGAGVLFWMWVSALLAMLIKYAEILLLMRKARQAPGRVAAPMLYMRPAFTAGLFCIAGLCCAFSVGSGLQATAVYQAFSKSFSLPPFLTCLLLALPALFCLLRKKSELFTLTAVIVPTMSVLYALFCLVVIIKYGAGLPTLLQRIVAEAFDFRPAAAGLTASAFTALRFGIVRGLLSNEAGCGTAPMAHAHAQTQPEAQARAGVIEVAVDTLLLCTLTGFVVLLCPGDAATPLEAVQNALASVFGRAASLLLPLSLYAFAFATLLCWSLYLDAFASYLFGGKKTVSVLFKLLFCSCAACAFLFPERLLWQIADAAVALMTLIQCSYLFAERKTIRA